MSRSETHKATMLTESSFSQSDLITLLVGEDESLFRVHKDLLLNKSGSKFFAACLSNFAESESNTIRLPEDGAASVRIFVEWLYSGQIASNPDIATGLLYPYKFGNKILSEQYCNALVDALRLRYALNPNHARQAHILYDAHRLGLSKTPLYRLVLMTTVRSMMNDKKWMEGNLVGKTQLAFIHKSKEVMEDVIAETMAYSHARYDSPALMPACRFHEHKESSTCSGTKK